MSIHVMSKIMRDRTYDGKQKLILLAIADMVDQDGVGFASYRMIKEVTEVSDEYLRQSIQRFVADGRLEILEKGTGRRHATVYRVKPPNSVAPNSVAESPEPPNSEPDNSPTPAGRTPQLQVVNSPTPSPNPPSYTSVLSTPVLDTSVAEMNLRGWDEFWRTYPRRTAKGAAERAWAKAIKKAAPEVIIQAAARFAADPNREATYTPHPATWLNEQRWEDDPLPERTTGTRAEAKTAHTRNLLAWAAGQDAMALEIEA